METLFFYRNVASLENLAFVQAVVERTTQEALRLRKVKFSHPIQLYSTSHPYYC